MKDEKMKETGHEVMYDILEI